MFDDHVTPCNLARKRNIVLLMALILVLAFGLRLHRLAYDSIWWDEGYSIWMARMPIQEMLFQTANDTHPPLSYMMLHGWRALTGDEEFALRMTSVFCGLLTVAMSYQIGRFRFQTGVNNLLNEAYFTRRATGYPGPGIIPAEGRSFYGTVRIRL